MAATGLQFNWDAVAIGSTEIDRVKSFNINPGIQFADWAADNDRYITATVQNMSTPTGQIVTGNIGVALGTLGLSGQTVTGTHLDALAASGGNIVYTVVGAYVTNVSATGPYGQYGEATIDLKFLSVDGVTSPISFTRS